MNRRATSLRSESPVLSRHARKRKRQQRRRRDERERVGRARNPLELRRSIVQFDVAERVDGRTSAATATWALFALAASPSETASIRSSGWRG